MKSLQELNERDSAFRERRPDPYRAPEPPGPVALRLERLGLRMVATLAGIALGLFLSFLIVLAYQLRLPALTSDSEQRFLNRLEMAVRNYEFDYDALPPAGPVGSAALAKALAAPSPSGQRHLFLEPGLLDVHGNLLTPEGRIVHYVSTWRSGTRWGFALWAGDVRGNRTGASTQAR